MGKNTGLYHPEKPPQRQSFWESRLYDEEAYTSHEKRIREKILIFREHSGLDRELLQTNEAWFQEDEALAFQIKNENAWFLKTKYIPRSHLTRDDFHISLPNQKQTWKKIASLRFKFGDFLLKRSEQHSEATLNEPMHFFYLDLLNILTRLAQSPDGEYVATQIPLVSQYLQQTSTLILNPKSSDKLFIENCRMRLLNILDHDIMGVLDSQQFSKTLSRLQLNLDVLGEQYHTLLHFALIDERVNPHPYWQSFLSNEWVEEKSAFPTLIASDCIASTSFEDDSESEFMIAMSTQCLDLKFSPDTTEKQQQLYMNNVMNLKELLRFKHMLTRAQTLTEQAGELITLHFFRDDLFNLFDQVEQFFLQSHHSILELLEENEKLHHNSIIELNQISWWENLWSNKPSHLNTFIANQINFSRFGINKQSLKKHLDRVTDLILRAHSQLRSPLLIANQNEPLFDMQNEAQALIEAIYHWRIEQNARAGLPLPPRPNLLAPSIEEQPKQQALFNESETPSDPLITSQTYSFFSAPPGQNLKLMGEPGEIQFIPIQANPDNNATGANYMLSMLLGLPAILILGLFLYRYFKPAKEKIEAISFEKEEDTHTISKTN